MCSSNTTKSLVPDNKAISVSCGCPGPLRTKFDKQAVLLEARTKEPRERYRSGRSKSVSNSEEAVALMVFAVMMLVGVAVFSENARRDRISWRAQATAARERDAQTGVELAERIPTGFGLHCVGERALEPAQ